MNPDDELLLSAVLDGEATDEEVARVEADGELRGRLASLRVAQAALAGPVPDADPERRDAAIAAAVVTMPAAPDELAARRSRTVVAWRRFALAAGAAAAAAVLVVGFVTLARSDSSTKAASTAAAPASSAAGSNTGQEAPPGPVLSAQDKAAAGAVGPTDLGSFATTDQLVARLRVVRDGLESASSAVSEASAPSSTTGQFSATSCPAPAGATFAGDALLAGQPVLVWLGGAQDAPIAIVVDVSCRTVLSQPL